MAASSPQVLADAGFKLTLTADGVSSGDIGDFVYRARFRGAINTGYMLYTKVQDPGYAILKRVFGSADPADLEYLQFGRKRILTADFSITYGPNSQPPDSGLDNQTAYVIGLRITGGPGPNPFFEFIAIDPPSWYLNAGNASGKAYRGKNVGEAIQQVIQDYAPNIQADVAKTSDGKQNTWYMMRQDPKTFIISLLDWSSPLTNSKTQWLVAMDGTKIAVKSQTEFGSQNRAFYRGAMAQADGDRAHIISHELIADSALTILNTKLVTQGISAVSGQYLDKTTDQAEQQVFADDATTENKLNASTSERQAFAGPEEGDSPDVGWTSIHAVPEIYSGGEIGKKYSDYIDGRARGLFLNMSNLVMRAKFQVYGHGVWHDTFGLGVDTITIDWLDADGQPFFFAGNWIVYGWEHRFSPGVWYTDVYAARLDYDAEGTAVP